MTKDEGAVSGEKHEDKTKGGHLENKSYGEVTSSLRRLLNKYEEGENRYQTLLRMMDSRTYPTKGAGLDKMVQAGTKPNVILKTESEDTKNDNI